MHIFTFSMGHAYEMLHMHAIAIQIKKNCRCHQSIEKKNSRYHQSIEKIKNNHTFVCTISSHAQNYSIMHNNCPEASTIPKLLDISPYQIIDCFLFNIARNLHIKLSQLKTSFHTLQEQWQRANWRLHSTHYRNNHRVTVVQWYGIFYLGTLNTRHDASSKTIWF